MTTEKAEKAIAVGMDIVRDSEADIIVTGEMGIGNTTTSAALASVLLDLPPKEIIKCTSWNQAHSLGLEGYGRLEPGYHADLAILDSGWNPLETWIGGVPRWKA